MNADLFLSSAHFILSPAFGLLTIADERKRSAFMETDYSLAEMNYSSSEVNYLSAEMNYSSSEMNYLLAEMNSEDAGIGSWTEKSNMRTEKWFLRLWESVLELRNER